MNSRCLTINVAIVVSLVGASAAVTRSSPEQQSARVQPTRSNIVLFIADDLGWQDIALPFADPETELSRRYRTPNLVRMAAEGMKSTNSYSAGPVCSPTRVAISDLRRPQSRTHRHLDRTGAGLVGVVAKDGVVSLNEAKSAVTEYPFWGIYSYEAYERSRVFKGKS